MKIKVEVRKEEKLALWGAKDLGDVSSKEKEMKKVENLELVCFWIRIYGKCWLSAFWNEIDEIFQQLP